MAFKRSGVRSSLALHQRETESGAVHTAPFHFRTPFISGPLSHASLELIPDRDRRVQP